MALFSTLVAFTCLCALASAQYVQFAEGIGYIGPACAVVDGNLYIHGIIVRALNSSEIAEFENYQDAISKLHKLRTSPPGLVLALSKLPDSKKPFMTQPIVPNFCYGLNDNTEVVLKGCIVRDSRVFIHGKLIRPLNSIERDAVSRLLTQRSRPQALFYQRKKREVESEATTTSAPVTSTTPLVLKGVHNDVAHLLEQFLHVNSTVAKRFLPVAKMSPLFNELSKEYAARGDGKSGNEDAHLRETRTAADSVLPADDYAPPANAFAMPSFAYAGSIEQPFQQQLPQLTPLPTFNHGSQNQEADPFAGHNFNSYPQNQNQNEYGNVNTFPAPTPIVSNSAYLVGGEEPVEVRGAIRQGEKYTIGGKNYVAVSMNELTPSQLAQIGQLYGNIQPGVGIGNNNNMNNGNNNQGYGSFVGQPQFPNTQTWQPYNPYQQAAAVPEPMSPFGQNFASQPMHKIRYHPGKETIVAPSLSQEALNAGMSVINQMPHHICSAHLSNPFWFLEKK